MLARQVLTTQATAPALHRPHGEFPREVGGTMEPRAGRGGQLWLGRARTEENRWFLGGPSLH
jgi:hypothetical protein